MKLVTFATTKAATSRVGIVNRIGKIFDLTAQMRGDESIYKNMFNLVANYKSTVSSPLRELSKYIDTSDAEELMIDPKYCRLLAPINPRRNVMCVGKNYSDHIKEIAQKLQQTTNVTPKVDAQSKYATFFTKAPECVIGPLDTIPNHNMITKYLDYEVELAVIIGTEGRDIKTADAWKHVMGFTIANDITARDVQRRHNQWFKGKTLDGTCPLGPYIIPLDTMDLAPDNLSLKLSINGEVRQNSNTKNMIFSVPEIIAQLSEGFTLKPGDVLLTGTPSGVGYALEPPRCLQPGDMVEAEIEGLGCLVNYVAL